MNFDVTEEKLYSEAQVALRSTRENRYSMAVNSSQTMTDMGLKIACNAGSITLTLKDEFFLKTCLTFGYVPLYLANQMYKSFRTQVSCEFDNSARVKDLVNFGIIYSLPSVIGPLLLPTNFLASLFGKKLPKFSVPVLNTVTHTVSEQDVYFRVMANKLKCMRKIPHLPYMSSLNLKGDTSGSLCVAEGEYGNKSDRAKQDYAQLDDDNARLMVQMRNGIQVTEDLLQNNFIIHKKFSENKYLHKVPDLVIPVPRKIVQYNGVSLAMPRSVALEVELTNKGKAKYEQLLEVYWNNLKFGMCVYLTPDTRIKNDILSAKAKLEKKLGNADCNIFVTEYVIPYDESQSRNFL